MPVKGFDCDNGSEFLTWHLLRYFQSHKQPIKFTSSRPYHSNDNAHVEQKNWSCVRQLFGYDRLADPRMVKLMNVYAHEFSLFTNFFCPTLKLGFQGARRQQVGQKTQQADQPAQRVLDYHGMSQDAKEKLSSQTKLLNPFQIQKQIQRKLSVIFKLLR